MTQMTVPTPPVLARVSNVELIQTGTWELSSGPTTFTSEDLIAAVAALDCPAVRRPILKLGHDGSHGAGEPALGYIDNLTVTDNYRTLTGDYAGMPGWLAATDDQGQSVLASAYPDRSVEAAYDFRCQMGHTHPFVVLAVSLLGVDRPGVGSLQSLQDLAALYGVEGVGGLDVAASTSPTTGTAVTVRASEGKPMPAPTPRQIAATVSADDVRRAFYESPIGSDWDSWIEEIQLDPLQIIYIDDDEGARFRVPVTIGAGDGPEAVTFGDPVKVVIRYDDATVAASAGNEPIRYATRAESRPGDKPKASQTPAVPPVVPSTDPKEADTMSDTVIQGLRKQLGLPDDADEATVLAANAEALAERAEPEKAPTIPDGHVVIDGDALEELRIAAKAGQEARSVQLRQTRDDAISAAVRAGHIAPARREHWAAKWDADPEGVSASIAELAKGEPIFPVAAASTGYAGAQDDITSEDELFGKFFPSEKAGV